MSQGGCINDTCRLGPLISRAGPGVGDLDLALGVRGKMPASALGGQPITPSSPTSHPAVKVTWNSAPGGCPVALSRFWIMSALGLVLEGQLERCSSFDLDGLACCIQDKPSGGLCFSYDHAFAGFQALGCGSRRFRPSGRCHLLSPIRVPSAYMDFNSRWEGHAGIGTADLCGSAGCHPGRCQSGTVTTLCSPLSAR